MHFLLEYLHSLLLKVCFARFGKTLTLYGLTKIILPFYESLNVENDVVVAQGLRVFKYLKSHVVVY